MNKLNKGVTVLVGKGKDKGKKGKILLIDAEIQKIVVENVNLFIN